MLLEFPYQNDRIKCQISLNEEYISLSSSLILQDLLKIQVEITEETPSLPQISVNTFPIKILNSKWFDSNIQQIMLHLEQNLFNKNQPRNRNLILQGSKGSGKTTLCKYLCNLISQKPYKALYHYINCQNFISKTPDTIYDQLKLVYKECLFYQDTPCLVVLENIDLLIENKTHTTDPSSLLYYSQIVEVIKELLNFVWNSKNPTRIVTLVTTSVSISELPSLFHCLDEHGLFTQFIQVKPHTDKEETLQILELILKSKNFCFESCLLQEILQQTDGFVFKDFEKLIEKIVFSKWENSENKSIELDKTTEAILYNYTCINMSETNFFKSRNKINWSLVGGLNKVKKSLVETLIWPIKYKDLYKKLSMKQSGGVLLYGPSGCGKTLIASALANESKFNFISVKGPELLSKYIGNSEQNVRDLFRKAQKAKPCIVFFDEFDSLAPKRGHDSTGVTDRVVNQLLTQLDGIEQLDGVYLLVATSRPDLIDSALLRPGRLDSYFYIGYPEKVTFFTRIEN